MKSCSKILLIAFAVLIYVSCAESEESATLCGEWKLVSIRTEVNDVPDEQCTESVFYTFEADSTFLIQEGDYEETGCWTLVDSILTMSPNDTDLVSNVKVIRLSEDSLIHESYSDSEFGKIHETMSFIRMKSEK
ncbi:MAG: lipocalin family protein [Bacteroidaceae bacterium]|nr:lipocalin family protein [Bacteroidaceae bacterium]